MKKFLKVAGVLAALGIVAVLVMFALLPWMDRWGATEEEIAAVFPGDELVPTPLTTYNRAITINAAPEEIYPWIAQMGADRGGMYSYTWFETNILRCELINADRIHTEWQDIEVGDKMKMCPDENNPPAYEVAVIKPNRAVVFGHQQGGKWSDVWQFILIPQEDGSTRLVLRSRDAKVGLIWTMIRPGEFIMMRGMLLGIKERAENLHLAAGG